MIGNLIFVLKAVDEAAAVSSGQSFWELYGTSILTLLGTLLGATVGAYTTWRTTRTGLRETRRDSLLGLRREEYFSAIGIVHRMERALLAMGSSLSGRENPNLFASRQRRKEAKERDEGAANALQSLFEANDELKLEVYRLAAIGSADVRQKLESISECVDEYLRTEFERGDNRFIAQNFNAAMAEYSLRLDAFVTSIRSDLRVDESIGK
ncbi:hypothetical protein [Schaalia suimastitidis]|uniref:hypothetical protein n=1 Tax=Schaalia suimastitidis TaxID=121163 RepID=UPI0004799D8A|nr:hypothetical protein [Schaalia suimastitidis]